MCWIVAVHVSLFTKKVNVFTLNWAPNMGQWSDSMKVQGFGYYSTRSSELRCVLRRHFLRLEREADQWPPAGVGVGFYSFIARANYSLPYCTIAAVRLLSSWFDTSSIHYYHRALHPLSSSAIILSFLFSTVRRFSTRRDGTHAVTAIALDVVYGVTAIALCFGIPSDSCCTVFWYTKLQLLHSVSVYQVTAVALGCSIRNPVEMRWHTVTYGRGSEGETGEWSG
jgi:hypothetical protein